LCYYCYKNNHNTADCKVISKFKQQKKARFEAKDEPGRSISHSLFFSKKLMHLKPEKTTSIKKRKSESILSTENNQTTSSDEDEDYLFTSSKSFSTSKTKIEKSYHTTTELVVIRTHNCKQSGTSVHSAS
jgi:hypothetical protein